jgi:hypothetical protein
MFWVNEEKTVGGAVFFGLGKSPGYWEQTQFSNTSRSIWTAIPITHSLFDNTISWDIMPGALYDHRYAETRNPAWGFT